MKFEVRDSRDVNDFEVVDFEIVKESTMRSMIAIAIIILCLFFLAGSAVYGLILGDFGALEAVVVHIQAPLGVLTGYYFSVKSG